MSLVVAIKQKDRIVLGADKQVSTGDSKDHTNTKIWEVEELPGAIMGSVGSARASQIIQYANVIDKNLINNNEISTDFIICALAPTLAAGLKAGGIKIDTPDEGVCEMMPNAFIFAYKDSAWLIWNDFSVTEITDYLAIGSGADVARGALYATKDKDPFSRIVTCIDAAAESTLFVDNGIDLLTTKDHTGDDILIAKAFGLEFEEELDKIEKAEKKKKDKEKSKK